MKQKIAAVFAFAALGLVQTHAMAFENLPEPQMGSGGTPAGTNRSDSGSSLLRLIDPAGSTGSDISDETIANDAIDASVTAESQGR